MALLHYKFAIDLPLFYLYNKKQDVLLQTFVQVHHVLSSPDNDVEYRCLYL